MMMGSAGTPWASWQNLDHREVVLSPHMVAAARADR